MVHLLGGHRGEVSAPFVCLDEDLVGQHVELRLRLALHVGRANGSEHIAERALTNRVRDGLARTRDRLEQQPQLRIQQRPTHPASGVCDPGSLHTARFTTLLRENATDRARAAEWSSARPAATFPGNPLSLPCPQLAAPPVRRKPRPLGRLPVSGGARRAGQARPRGLGRRRRPRRRSAASAAAVSAELCAVRWRCAAASSVRSSRGGSAPGQIPRSSRRKMRTVVGPQPGSASSARSSARGSVMTARERTRPP